MGAPPIERLLVANRGAIARRIFRTCRELGVATVAVFSEADAGAPFAGEADVAVALGGLTAAESYLRGDAIVRAALATGADAVHPGYGFLSENAGFARAVLDAGLTWVGPSPEVIASMGSKVEARALMEQAGIPVLPGRTVGPDTGDHAALAEAVGYPLLVKASAGGGGKGMRLVRDAGELERAVAAAGREALAAFGDGTLFLERYLDAPRHVEIQIFGDASGRVVSLFERECSIQRRHQKVLEEAPSPAVDEALRARMGAAAVAAAESLGYVGAGTVEFLLGPGGEFFFLEVNTRLQVEHGVTELVTGLDLVALQLRVAEGRELPPEARTPALRGHAIEARLYAEDPANDFLPATGTLERFAIPGDVRVDSGVQDGSHVGPHYDPLLAKVIAWAPDREVAARRLAGALRAAELHGPVTNRDLLVRVLSHPAFRAGATDTHFLERHDLAALAAPLLDAPAEGLHAAAAALAAQAARRAGAPVLGGLPSGWRNNPSQPQSVTYDGRHGTWTVAYRFDRSGRLASLTVGDRELETPRLHACAPDLVDLEVAGVRARYGVRRAGDGATHVTSASGATALRAHSRFPGAEPSETPGALVSPMPGSVLSVLVAPGSRVQRGEPLLVIEAMKMEHEIVAPAGGQVTELLVEQGAHVDSGALLAVIETL